MPPPRKRQRNIGPSLTAPERVFEDGAQVRLIRELQESVELLWRRAQETTPSAPVPSISEADLRRMVADTVNGSHTTVSVGGIRLSNDTPLAHGDTGSPGGGATAARSTHRHPGFNWRGTVGTRPSDTPTGPESCFHTSADGGSGDNEMYFRHPNARSAAWWRFPKTTTGTSDGAAPTTNVQDGDMYVNTTASPDRRFLRMNGAWVNLSLVYESSNKLKFDPASGTDIDISHFG